MRSFITFHRARHAGFQVTEKAAERWMQHMDASMDAVNIPEKAKKALHRLLPSKH
jgi:truncated hemoglobin YjbI